MAATPSSSRHAVHRMDADSRRVVEHAADIMKVSLHDLLQVAPIMRPRAQSREQGTSGIYREWTTTQRAIIHLAAEILDVSFEDLVKIAFLLRPVDAGVHSRGGADIRSAEDNTSSTQQLITDVLPATTGPMVSDPSLFSDGLAEGTPLTSGTYSMQKQSRDYVASGFNDRLPRHEYSF